MDEMHCLLMEDDVDGIKALCAINDTMEGLDYDKLGTYQQAKEAQQRLSDRYPDCSYKIMKLVSVG